VSDIVDAYGRWDVAQQKSDPPRLKGGRR
jgi:hypothetical protein